MGIDSLSNGITSTITEHPLGSTIGALGAGVALGVGGAAVVGAIKQRRTKRRKSRNSRKRGRRIHHTRRGWKQDRARRSKQPWELAYRRRKKKHSSRRRGKIYYAKKTGQPYIILSNGRAKFIKGKRRK